MSVESISAALSIPDLTPALKLLLVGIANHDGDGGAWPSVDRLAGYTCVTPRQVQRLLRQLEELGLVETMVQEGGAPWTRGDRRPNRYRLLIDGATSAPPRVNGATPTSPRECARGDIQGTHGVTSMSPEPSLEPSVTDNRQGARRRKADDAPAGFIAFWSIYPRKVDRKRALKAYKGTAPDDVHLLLDGAEAWAAYWRREGTEEKFIPHAATWLNNERWLVPPPATTGTSDEIERLRELMMAHFDAIGVPLPDPDVIRTVAKMCAGPGEVAMRFAVAAKIGTSLESAIDVVRSTQDRVTRFKGDPNPLITGDPVDYALAMRRARSNVAWRQA